MAKAKTRKRKERKKMAGEDRMVDIEEQPGAAYDTLHVRVPIPKRLLPRETREHTKAAIREVLLAGRSLLDVAIDELGGDAGAKTERIQVD